MLRWADERSGTDRRAQAQARARERRSDEPGEREGSRRKQRLGMRQERETRIGTVLLIALAIAALVGASAWVFGPAQPIAVRIGAPSGR